VFPGFCIGINPFLSLYYPLSSLISQPENRNHHLQPQDLPPKHHLHADDTQLYISFRPGNFSNAQSCMHRQIASISSWMTSNFYSLNPSKPEFLLIGLPQKLAKVNQPVLHLPDNTTATPVTNARNLEMLFDSSMSFKQHINYLTKTYL